MNRIVFSCAIAVATLVTTASIAENHVITATGNFTWSYNGKSSPLVEVADLNVGDTIEIKIPGGTHGFTTIDKNANDAVGIGDPVMTCDETDAQKPHAVLREKCDSGAPSQFNKRFRGSMQLEVLSSFKDDVPFWCIVHTSGMQGVLKLKPNTSSAAKPK